MATVTYHHQPAIQATRGAVGSAGNCVPYTVSKVLWPDQVTDWIRARLIGKSLHVCCGMSDLGTYRVDLHWQPWAHVRADASRLPFLDQSVSTVLCDPPYNGKYNWNHRLLEELARVARDRIIFQHWFMPVDERDGGYRKARDRFRLSEVAVWMPRTYFGRVQAISVFDSLELLAEGTPSRALATLSSQLFPGGQP